MSYLVNPFERCYRCLTSLRLPMLYTFKDVKKLFMLALGLTVILSPALFLFLKEHLAILYHNGLRFVMGHLCLLAWLPALIGFDTFLSISMKFFFEMILGFLILIQIRLSCFDRKLFYVYFYSIVVHF